MTVTYKEEWDKLVRREKINIKFIILVVRPEADKAEGMGEG